jgi:hypothetical protein
VSLRVLKICLTQDQAKIYRKIQEKQQEHDIFTRKLSDEAYNWERRLLLTVMPDPPDRKVQKHTPNYLNGTVSPLFPLRCILVAFLKEQAFKIPSHYLEHVV